VYVITLYVKSEDLGYVTIKLQNQGTQETVWKGQNWI